MRETDPTRRAGRIPLMGLPNTRDLGGIAAAGGGRIEARRLIRSGALHSATEEDLRVLRKRYHLSAIVDFRTGVECAQEPDPQIDGVIRHHLPVLDEKTVGITFEKEEEDSSLTGFLRHADSLGGNSKGYMGGLYRQLVLDETARARYGRFFELLLEQGEGAVLWHCSAGKDRAGLGTALVLTALGVDRETVLRDYTLTNEYLKEETDKLVLTVLQYRDDPVLAECVRALNGVDASYLESAFAAMEELCGTVDRYLADGLGLTEEKRARLQEKYLAADAD